MGNIYSSPKGCYEKYNTNGSSYQGPGTAVFNETGPEGGLRTITCDYTSNWSTATETDEYTQTEIDALWTDALLDADGNAKDGTAVLDGACGLQPAEVLCVSPFQCKNSSGNLTLESGTCQNFINVSGNYWKQAYTTWKTPYIFIASTLITFILDRYLLHNLGGNYGCNILLSAIISACILTSFLHNTQKHSNNELVYIAMVDIIYNIFLSIVLLLLVLQKGTPFRNTLKRYVEQKGGPIPKK